jgi:hypothetical protein
VPKYQTISEAAKRLGYSEAYLRELAGTGKVPGATIFAGSWAIPLGFRRRRQKPGPKAKAGR